MGTQRYIDTSFWDDTWVQELDPSEKLLYIYLLTNPLTNIAGVSELTNKRISFDTGFNNDTIGHIMTKFENAKKVYRFNNYVIIRNFPKHQQIESEKILKGIVTILAKLPQDVLEFLMKIGYALDIKKSFDTVGIPYPYPLNYLNLNLNSNSNLNLTNEENSEKKSEKTIVSKEYPKEAAELTQILYEECKKENSNFSKTQKELDKWSDSFEKLNRIDGYSYDIIKQVLLWAKNDSFWKQNIISGVKFRDKFEQLYIKSKGKSNKYENRMSKTDQFSSNDSDDVIF